MAKEWVNECEKFQSWYKRLGGDMGNAVAMTRAMRKIEPKQVSEKSIYKILAR